MKRLTLHICHLETESKRFYIILALILLLVVIFFLFNKGWGLSDDVWETAAAIREISTNPLQPNNPILALQGSTSPRFVPYVIFWGLFKKVTSADIFLTIGIAAIMNYLIIMTGLFRLVSILFKNKAMPVYVMITMLMVWGKGYGWANAYQFELFIENIPHVGFFTFGLTMHALYYLARFFKKKKWPDFLLYSLFSVIVFITHPITGLFCFVAAFALEFTHEKFWKVVLWQSIPAIAVALSFIWPYFKYWDVFLQGTQNEWFQSSLFSNQILALGPSLLGFPIAIYYGLKKKNRFLIYGLSLCSFIYLFSAVTEIKIGGRFIFFTAFFLHLTIACYLRENNMLSRTTFKESLRTNGLIYILMLTIFVPSLLGRVYGMGWHVRRMVDKPLKIHGYYSPVAPYLFISEYLTDTDIVFVNAEEGWVIPALTGAKIIEPLHSSPTIGEEILDRKRDVAQFFYHHLTLEERQTMIAKYGATHIMVNLINKDQWDLSFKNDLNLLGREEVRENKIILYKIASER